MKITYTCDWCGKTRLWLFHNSIGSRKSRVICSFCMIQYNREHSFRNHNKRIMYKKMIQNKLNNN